MFLGQFEHALDPKGRVILPARYREQLEAGAYLSKALEGCVAIYPAEEFERVAAELMEKSRRGPKERQAARTFAANASPASIDRQGRMLIPANLREFAGLEKDVVIAGSLNSVEVWDAGRWREMDREGDMSLVMGGPGLDDLGI